MRIFLYTNFWAYRLDRREPAKSERLKPWLAEVIAEHDVVIRSRCAVLFFEDCGHGRWFGGLQVVNPLRE